MNKRRALTVIAVSMGAILIDLVLVRLMAHGHVAHVLLGAGSSAPPIGPALLAIALVIARLAAIVIAPGALLAALASLVAHVVVGPEAGDGGGAAVEGQRGAGSSISSGTGTKSDALGAALGTG